MKIADSRLNNQVLISEETETKIRIITKREYFNFTPKFVIDKKIQDLISKAVNQIKIPRLKKAVTFSLLDFYNRQYRELLKIHRSEIIIALALISLEKNPYNTKAKTSLLGHGFKITGKYSNLTIIPPKFEISGENKGNLNGVPLNKFSQDYIKEKIEPTINKLTKQYALDPDDISGRNSLRNRAEMEVRYNAHQQNIEDLKRAGNKLVIASSHSDCSDRCYKWQGRVYSLDGTSGTTKDGQKYIPLEIAVNQPYTTKAGITYMNGLLGFNCRHYLIAYKTGVRFPKVAESVQRKQDEITKNQRAFERTIRHWRINAIENKNLNEKKYLIAKNKVNKYYNEYIKFSRENNRAYMPINTKVI